MDTVEVERETVDIPEFEALLSQNDNPFCEDESQLALNYLHDGEERDEEDDDDVIVPFTLEEIADCDTAAALRYFVQPANAKYHKLHLTPVSDQEEILQYIFTTNHLDYLMTISKGIGCKSIVMPTAYDGVMRPLILDLRLCRRLSLKHSQFSYELPYVNIGMWDHMSAYFVFAFNDNINVRRNRNPGTVRVTTAQSTAFMLFLARAFVVQPECAGVGITCLDDYISLTNKVNDGLVSNIYGSAYTLHQIQLAGFHEYIVEHYSDWVQSLRDVSEDDADFFAVRHPRLLVTENGQDVTLKFNDSTNDQTIKDYLARLLNIEEVGHIGMALATNFNVRYHPEDDEAMDVTHALLLNLSEVRHIFPISRSNIQEFPLAFSNALGNIASTDMPTAFIPALTRVNDELSEDLRYPAISHAHTQIYSQTKQNLRKTKAEQDLAKGLFTPSLASRGWSNLERLRNRLDSPTALGVSGAAIQETFFSKLENTPVGLRFEIVINVDMEKMEEDFISLDVLVEKVMRPFSYSLWVNDDGSPHELYGAVLDAFEVFDREIFPLCFKVLATPILEVLKMFRRRNIVTRRAEITDIEWTSVFERMLAYMVTGQRSSVSSKLMTNLGITNAIRATGFPQFSFRFDDKFPNEDMSDFDTSFQSTLMEWPTHEGRPLLGAYASIKYHAGSANAVAYMEAANLMRRFHYGSSRSFRSDELVHQLIREVFFKMVHEVHSEICKATRPWLEDTQNRAIASNDASKIQRAQLRVDSFETWSQQLVNEEVGPFTTRCNELAISVFGEVPTNLISNRRERLMQSGRNRAPMQISTKDFATAIVNAVLKQSKPLKFATKNTTFLQSFGAILRPWHNVDGLLNEEKFTDALNQLVIDNDLSIFPHPSQSTNTNLFAHWALIEVNLGNKRRAIAQPTGHGPDDPYRSIRRNLELSGQMMLKQSGRYIWSLQPGEYEFWPDIPFPRITFPAEWNDWSDLLLKRTTNDDVRQAMAQLLDAVDLGRPSHKYVALVCFIMASTDRAVHSVKAPVSYSTQDETAVQSHERILYNLRHREWTPAGTTAKPISSRSFVPSFIAFYMFYSDPVAQKLPAATRTKLTKRWTAQTLTFHLLGKLGWVDLIQAKNTTQLNKGAQHGKHWKLKPESFFDEKWAEAEMAYSTARLGLVRLAFYRDYQTDSVLTDLGGYDLQDARYDSLFGRNK